MLEFFGSSFFFVANVLTRFIFRYKNQPIACVFRLTSIGIHFQQNSVQSCTCSITDVDRHWLIIPPVAIEIEPSPLQGLIRFCDDRHRGAFNTPQVSLPLNDLVFTSCVRWIVIFNASNEQRWNINDSHLNWFSASITSLNQNTDGLINSSSKPGYKRLKLGLSLSANHLHHPAITVV